MSPESATTAPTNYLQLLAGMILFGSGTPVSKLVSESFPHFVAAELRMLVALLVLLPFAWRYRRQLRGLSSGTWARLALIALIGMFGFSLFILYGIMLVSGTVGSIVTSTVPAATAIGSFAFLHESLGWKKALAIGLSVAGVLLVGLSGEPSAAPAGMMMKSTGILFVLAAVASEAAHTLIAKVASRELPPLLILTTAVALAIPMFAVPAVYQGFQFDFNWPTTRDWLVLAWWGAATTAAGSLLWYRGISQVPASVAAGFMGISPISAALISYLLLMEPPHWSHFIGFALVLLGVALITWEHRTGVIQARNRPLEGDGQPG